jgi:hypothetical protein
MATFKAFDGISILPRSVADKTKPPALSALLCHARRRLAVRLWRIKFFAAYVLAISCHRRVASNLLLFTKRAFAHPWATQVTLEFRPSTPSPDDRFPIDAPVVLSVWREDKRAVVMAGYFVGRCCYVRQLQGTAGINIPKDLDWTGRFIAGCQAFVRSGGCKQVRVVRACDLIRGVNLEKGARENETVEHARERILRKLTLHYDDTAKQFGFVPVGRWTVWWHSPKKPDPQPIRAQITKYLMLKALWQDHR